VSAGAADVDAPPIFISYRREDVEAARKLSNAITELGGDVWLDERRLLPGDTWEQEIHNAIKTEVGLFIAVVSANTELPGPGFVYKEWLKAVDRKDYFFGRRFLVPVSVDSTWRDPAGYKRIPPEFLPANFGHAPGGVPDGNLSRLLRDEIRAMRRPGAS
jgi:hypothetical protein